MDNSNHKKSTATELLPTDQLAALQAFLKAQQTGKEEQEVLQTQLEFQQTAIQQLEEELLKVEAKKEQLLQLLAIKDNKILLLEDKLTLLSTNIEEDKIRYISTVEGSLSWKIGRTITNFFGTLLKWIPFLRR